MNTRSPVVLITGALTGIGRASAKARFLTVQCLAVDGGFIAQ